MRVRFAPSPTGYLHVGGARTALFNWLFARHHGGVFVLRVEDTDTTRNRPEYTKAIYDGLHWLGLEWDEGPDRGGPHGPYLQSERNDRHLHIARQLVERGLAYECFCDNSGANSIALNETDDPDNVAGDWKIARDPNVATDRPQARDNVAGDRAHAKDNVAGDWQVARSQCSCLTLSSETRAARREDKPPAIRFRVPPGRDFVVDDLIRGKVTFPGETLGDFVIATGDGRALYNLAATIDDNDMAITHVIRGEEHLANTPKQQLLYEAMGWKAPQFAHIPIILNSQRRKLSKRDGATSLNEYQAMGFLPDAVVNFLALLGWSPGGNRELLRRDELVAAFDLDRVVKHPAIFDTAKLGWLNKEYIKAMPATELAARIDALISTRSVAGDWKIAPDQLQKVAALLHDRVKTIVEVLELGSYFFTAGPIQPTEEAIAKYCASPEVLARLHEVREALAHASGFDAADVERAIRDLAAAKGIKPSEYIHPLRVAVTGQSVSPGIFEVCAILGRDVVLKRIDALVRFLSSANLTAKVVH